jgi:hypothetical protein
MFAFPRRLMYLSPSSFNLFTMTCAITVASDNKYIILKFQGDVTRQSTGKYILEAHELGRKLCINEYLVDMTESRNVDPVIENYEYVHIDMEQAAIPKTARVALLVAPDDHSHDFIVTVFRNAGHNLKLFTDRSQAIRHLLKDSSAASV